MRHNTRSNSNTHIEEATYTSVKQLSPDHLSAIEQKQFDEVENAASEILYRCIDCRNCQKCKNGERTESISIKEEVEQDIINKSVFVDTNKGKTEAKLPFIQDPSRNLAPNKEKALAVYNSQVRRLS